MNPIILKNNESPIHCNWKIYAILVTNIWACVSTCACVPMYEYRSSYVANSICWESNSETHPVVHSPHVRNGPHPKLGARSRVQVSHRTTVAADSQGPYLKDVRIKSKSQVSNPRFLKYYRCLPHAYSGPTITNICIFKLQKCFQTSELPNSVFHRDI